MPYPDRECPGVTPSSCISPAPPDVVSYTVVGNHPTGNERSPRLRFSSARLETRYRLFGHRPLPEVVTRCGVARQLGLSSAPTEDRTVSFESGFDTHPCPAPLSRTESWLLPRAVRDRYKKIRSVPLGVVGVAALMRHQIVVVMPVYMVPDWRILSPSGCGA